MALPARRLKLASCCAGAAAALALAACGSGSVDALSSAAEDPAARAGSEISAAAADGPAQEQLWPGEGHRIASVRKGERVAVRERPNGPLVERVGSRTDFGSPRVFSVLERAGDWIAVATPVTGDNSPGWVRIDEERLRLGRVPFSITATGISISTPRFSNPATRWPRLDSPI